MAKENEKTEVLDSSGEVISGKYEIKLSAPYTFEGTEYKAVNLSRMQEMTAEDMVTINRRMTRRGNADFMPETTLEYALEVASVASELPIEFFRGLPMKDALKVKTSITGFMWG